MFRDGEEVVKMCDLFVRSIASDKETTIKCNFVI